MPHTTCPIPHATCRMPHNTHFQRAVLQGLKFNGKTLKQPLGKILKFWSCQLCICAPSTASEVHPFALLPLPRFLFRKDAGHGFVDPSRCPTDRPRWSCKIHSFQNFTALGAPFSLMYFTCICPSLSSMKPPLRMPIALEKTNSR